MDESFELPVMYKGDELLFTARLQQFGYSHRFVVDVYGTEVFFEPDEERFYRAMIDPDKTEKQLPVDLLQAIAEGIASVLK